MKNRHLLVLLFFLLPCTLIAQSTPAPSITVKGVFLDSLTQESEPYATIRIALTTSPDKPVKMAVTDTNGKFQEKFPAAPGNYLITLSSVGKTTVTKEFVVEAGKSTLDLGTIYTTEATNELKGVEVVAQKPLVKVDVDKIEYNIEDDPDSKSNSILEMLRKVPLVTVDGEDNVQVNGSSSFKIHVNGKPNSMMSNNPKEVLKSMPANTIKYVEVITSPGAKYDAEGVGGILNIVTIGGGIEGYTATISGRGGNRGTGGGVYATVKTGKLTLSGNYNYEYSYSPEYYFDTQQENYDSDDQKFLESSSTSKNTGNFQYGNLEASYEIDTLRLITVSAGLWGGGNDSDSWGPTAMYAADHLAKAYSYDMNSNSDGSWYSIRGGLDYQRTSSRNKARMLTLSYKIDTRPNANDYFTNYTNLYQVPTTLRRLNSHTDESTNTTEQTFQADYTTPIGKIHTIETGVKYIFRNNVSETDYSEATPGTNDYKPDGLRTSHYKHLNNIVAAYLGYTLRYKKFSFKPGVRYEHTSQDVKFRVGRGDDFTTRYNDIVPSVSLGWKVGPTQNLTASYNMRIWRPGIWFLNPYFNDTNPLSISQGNPLLDTEKGHAFNLGFSSFTNKINLNLSLRYSINDNGIERVSRLYEDGGTTPDGHEIPAGAVYSTYANIGKSQRTGLNTYINWNASPNTRMYLSGSVDYNDIRSRAQEMHSSGWGGSAYGGVQHTFPWKIRASLNSGGATSRVSLQGTNSGYFYYSLGLNRMFLKEDRLTLSISCSNIFKDYNTYTSTTQGPNFLMSSSSKYPSRYLSIGISYRLGKLQATVKKAARTISNDDVKGGGDSGGGGGGQGGN